MRIRPSAAKTSSVHVKSRRRRTSWSERIVGARRSTGTATSSTIVDGADRPRPRRNSGSIRRRRPASRSQSARRWNATGSAESRPVRPAFSIRSRARAATSAGESPSNSTTISDSIDSPTCSRTSGSASLARLTDRQSYRSQAEGAVSPPVRNGTQPAASTSRTNGRTTVAVAAGSGTVRIVARTTIANVPSAPQRRRATSTPASVAAAIA